MDGTSLVEVYFQTTLELSDSTGKLWEIRPLADDESGGDNPRQVLDPYEQAFILTAENPESLGLLSAEQNAEATLQLRRLLEASGRPFLDCPGYAWDSEHVEPGFAVLARADNAGEIQGFVMGLAEAFRQNAIFHLNNQGLGIIGVLREDLSGQRPVSVTAR